MALVQNPNTFVLSGVEDLSPKENMERICKLLMSIIPSTNNFVVTMSDMETSAYDPIQLADILNIAKENVDKHMPSEVIGE